MPKDLALNRSAWKQLSMFNSSRPQFTWDKRLVVGGGGGGDVCFGSI
jgi:hypothetical protein